MIEPITRLRTSNFDKPFFAFFVFIVKPAEAVSIKKAVFYEVLNNFGDSPFFTACILPRSRHEAEHLAGRAQIFLLSAAERLQDGSRNFRTAGAAAVGRRLTL